MNGTAAGSPLALRLSLARASAWALLVAGWVGLGSFAVVLAPGLDSAFALVALWLLLLGAAASVGATGSPRRAVRRLALAACAGITATALYAAPRGGGLPALLLALVGWAGLTALASGVVRSLRLAQPLLPGPPIGAASLGALCAGVALADLGDLHALALRLGLLLLLSAALLLLMQRGGEGLAQPSRCRAGLFDCSLPAWPVGAWNDPLQWPTLLAGLAMLPMMASLPLMVAWCRADAIAPQLVVALHLAAMFLPPLLLRRRTLRWSARRLAAMCTLALASGAVMVLWAAPPLNLIGLAVSHGAAWGLAWAGQLWAPDRRSKAGASPLRAALGYALLTLAFGVVIDQFGATGLGLVHAALGLAASVAWLYGTLAARAHPPPVPHAGPGGDHA